MFFFTIKAAAKYHIAVPLGSAGAVTVLPGLQTPPGTN
jgi:hypothetical protein